MKVVEILKLKGSNEVETISPEASVAEAAARLAEKRIGAVVVTRGEEIAGILSERDIVRALGRSGSGCLTMTVGELMTQPVETCAPDDTANSVLERMTRGRFRHMPVVADGKMVGLISIGDVVKARIMEIERENQAMASLLGG